MLIDQLGVFFDSAAAAATAASPGVSVSPHAGRGEPVNITMIVTGPNVAAVSLAVKLQESDGNTAFTDVAGFTLEKTGAAEAVLAFALPSPVKKKFVRLSYTLAGTPTGLKVFAAITRDHFAPYAAGQYIDRGNMVA